MRERVVGRRAVAGSRTLLDASATQRRAGARALFPFLAEERAEAVAGHVAWVLSTHFRADVIGEV